MTCSCGATTSNGLALCEKCRTTLTVSLVNVASYHSDVLAIQPGETVKTRSSYRSTPPPSLLPKFDPISDVADAVATMIFGWCRVLTDDRPQVGAMPADTVKRCAWLEHHLTTIATLEWGGELLRDCLGAERRLLRILDRADTGWYAGKCGAVLSEERFHDGTTCVCSCHIGLPCDIEGGCGEPGVIPAVTCERGLYATPGHGWVRCPECGTTHDAGARRDTLIREARDQLAPVAVIARAVVGLLDTEQSVEKLTNRIDQWVSRGQLHDYGVRSLAGAKPGRVYRLGDVFDKLNIGTTSERHTA